MGELVESTQFTVERLIEAAWLDDEQLEPLVLRMAPKQGQVLHYGMIKKESGSTLASAANGSQNRFFVIDIDQEWRPRLSYYKDVFQASECQPYARPHVLGTFNLASFTFTPTKQARSSENARSWRLDVTGTSKGSMSGSKRDKLVLVFSNDEDCHAWQATFRVCQIGVQAFARRTALKERHSELSAADTSIVQFHEKETHASASSRAVYSSDLSVLCGQSLALCIPPAW